MSGLFGDDGGIGIEGGTDGTKIGNVGDRLKVDSTSSFEVGAIPTWGTDVRYEDMNASTGGVARDTAIGNTFTTVYSRTGSGYFTGFLVTLENAFDEWEIRSIVDSNTIFTLNTKDLENPDIYGFDKGGSDDLQTVLGISVHDKTFRWTPPLKNPMTYTSSIQVQVRYVKGGSKKFKAGLATRTV